MRKPHEQKYLCFWENWNLFRVPRLRFRRLLLHNKNTKRLLWNIRNPRWPETMKEENHLLTRLFSKGGYTTYTIFLNPRIYLFRTWIADLRYYHAHKHIRTTNDHIVWICHFHKNIFLCVATKFRRRRWIWSDFTTVIVILFKYPRVFC